MTARALRPGDQLASTACTTRVIVVRAPAGDSPEIACGGSPMTLGADAAPPPPKTPAPPSEGETATLIGKRYVNAAETLELLCTSSGTGGLTCDGVPMARRNARPLPASD